MLRGVIACLYIAVNTVFWCTWLFPLALLRWLVRVDAFRHRADRALDGIVDAWVSGNRVLVRVLSLIRLDLEWQGDETLSRDAWYLLVSNHQTWADIILLQNSMRHRIPVLKFFVKQELIWIPFLGLAMYFLGFPYVKRYSSADIARNPALREVDRQATSEACELFKRQPTSVINFLEGTRFTPEKHAYQSSPYRHLLVPKTGGFGYVLEALDARIHKVLDVTIVYDERPPTFWEFLCGRCRHARMVVDVIDPPRDPDREQRRHWIDERWLRKDALIETLSA